MCGKRVYGFGVGVGAVVREGVSSGCRGKNLEHSRRTTSGAAMLWERQGARSEPEPKRDFENEGEAWRSRVVWQDTRQ